MNWPIVRHNLVCAGILFLSVSAGGCATVVAPIPVSDSVSSTVRTDDSHGLLFGNMRLTWHSTADRSEGIKLPQGMRWTLEEEAKGKRFVIADLPTDGPFVVKLPAGSYRVKGISFDSLWGIWHTVLPTTFQIQPRGCTSLGTWELQRETEFNVGWITGQVLEDIEPAEGELEQVLVRRECPNLAAPLDPSMRSKLAFQNRLSGLNYSD